MRWDYNVSCLKLNNFLIFRANRDTCSDSRYLLILTDKYSALPLLQHDLLASDKAVVIFGSSFPNDQEYAQVSHLIMSCANCLYSFKRGYIISLLTEKVKRILFTKALELPFSFAVARLFPIFNIKPSFDKTSIPVCNFKLPRFVETSTGSRFVWKQDTQ